ncbi:AtzE family amidohydrolase [Commensalibacter papalotli (ex Botero et al. 2024)]|uniref:Asp-tRNAAsn/Glu-tRNAGln amidotransferase A subunit or related amidase (GatA) (PDB:3H0L) n=1 Tax=Commensalibacter papalotli (ex Botero et al. 2024) TaxID=2972766 RepID=A0ABM9HJU7_9PROT|nr:AtzE family amidohydrolase [Commensalibacter papalotli (ex Botero et al. 2024)]CAI3923005.1 Asp-tRNAAsn/Glu-tRNAGln amidotransferase A subunit or related amidase (GatA) (PDB:3H0L) [Commensalibacter papalotli (ex Botero et al. 2024)]CAI3929015.1 Asp-tRNAAsn/Glu-tRNAGln amidotransferase A subunit or related amidase (GatA) (PDB:3H0L) [Commensalibacter papalotli (ex Botero et al. 2024)]
MRSVKDIANSIRLGRASAQQTISHYLQIIRQYDPPINSVTRILGERALKAAERIDLLIATGQDPGPLAGVPFAVKDLFDVQDEVTTAGSKILSKKTCANQDAEVIQRLCKAGAIPVATLNMDEFAYGFVTDNVHHGMTYNPHDLSRFAGGSSGGSAASVGGGIIPFSLGSDTNGSIRVPASLCGVWGIRPTFGLMPMQGVYPFAKSFDTIGPFCQTVEDLKLVFNVMAGVEDNASILPSVSDLRIAQVGGWFERDVEQDILKTIQEIMHLFSQQKKIEIPYIEQVRTASYLMTASEGGNLHLPMLRTQPLDYDPATRDRLMAGAMLPVASYLQAQKVKTWFQNYLAEIFKEYDLLIAPAVGAAAPLIDNPIVYVDGQPVPARVHLGIYTQPFSMSKCPVLSIPFQRKGKPPVGLQLIAQPYQEKLLFAVGSVLEQNGLAKASIIHRDAIT